MVQNSERTHSNVIPFDAENTELDVNKSSINIEMHKIDLDKLISQYYYARSIEQDTSTLDFTQELERSSEELAFTILTQAAAEPRQVLLKLNILENELATELETGAAFDGKYLVMFAGLKSDIIRLSAHVESF